jgi:transposase
MRPTGSPKALEQRRVRAISLLGEGWTPVEVARRLGVDRRSVRRWRASHDQSGDEGLQAKPASGRPPKLSTTDRTRLERDLLKGAKAFGFATDLWTCPRVVQLIRRRYRVRYHVDHVCRLLRSMDWSPQKPTRCARERDEEAIRGWVKKTWRRVKKTPHG